MLLMLRQISKEVVEVISTAKDSKELKALAIYLPVNKRYRDGYVEYFITIDTSVPMSKVTKL